MKCRNPHHSPEEITRKLQRAKQMMADGVTVEDTCRALNIGSSTLYRWRNRYGDMNWRQARQLYEYETENRRLKSRLTQKHYENLVLRWLVDHDYVPQPADEKKRDNNRGMWYGSDWTEAVPGLSRRSDRVVSLESHRPPAVPCRSERTGGA